MADEQTIYKPLPTLRKFHASDALIRCIVGPVGSGKSSAAAWEVCYYLPRHLRENYGITNTRWVIVRNTYQELMGTTMRTIMERWFKFGKHRVQAKEYILDYDGLHVELWYRSCDNPKDVRQFKSLEVTGYLIDESIEVSEETKLMLKNRIARYPAAKHWPKLPNGEYDVQSYGIETTNPPDVEHPTYSQFKWVTPVPGPVPTGKPLARHIGFWQPPGENAKNLAHDYYDNLRDMYRDNTDWLAQYVEGKPGIIITGKIVYHNFVKEFHVAKAPLVWSKGPLFVGWDNTGNCPAAVICQMPTANQVQVLREYHTDRMDIASFAEYVVTSRNRDFPNAKYTEWGDPAGENKFSKRTGDLTSNAEIMRECGIELEPSEQNFEARVSAVDTQLRKIIGGEPGLLIDPGCTRLINGFMGGYCYGEIGTTGIYKNDPINNKFSHVSEALQYVVLKLVRTDEHTKRFTMQHFRKKRRNTTYMAA